MSLKLTLIQLWQLTQLTRNISIYETVVGSLII